MNFRHIKSSRVTLSIVLILLASASSAPAYSATVTPPIAASLDAILDAHALRGGVTAAIVERVSDRRIFYERNIDTRLMPASNRKLFTAAAGLALLGSQFQFHTDLLSTALPDSNGVLTGNVYLRGGGDSTLTQEDLAQMGRELAKMGVKKITGDVIGDGSLFTDGPYGAGWGWDYLSDDYAPEIAGLEIERGDIAVHVAGSEMGKPPVVSVNPVTGYMPVVNLAHTGAKGTESTCVVRRPWNKNVIEVTGSMPIDKPLDISITVADPPSYAATVLLEILRRGGIEVTGRALAGRTPSNATVVLASHLSMPLNEYVRLMNKPSDNLLAESLVRAVGFHEGHEGSYEAGHKLEMKFFDTLGITKSEVELRDGCGVSRLDLVTARAVADLLTGIHNAPYWPAFYDSLPIAGRDGTLRRRMRGTKAEGNVHGKTGTLTGACCLSGYVTGTQGELFAFSLLMNNFPGALSDVRGLQDHWVETLAISL